MSFILELLNLRILRDIKVNTSKKLLEKLAFRTGEFGVQSTVWKSKGQGPLGKQPRLDKGKSDKQAKNS